MATSVYFYMRTKFFQRIHNTYKDKKEIILIYDLSRINTNNKY